MKLVVRATLLAAPQHSSLSVPEENEEFQDFISDMATEEDLESGSWGKFTIGFVCFFPCSIIKKKKIILIYSQISSSFFFFFSKKKGLSGNPLPENQPFSMPQPTQLIPLGLHVLLLSLLPLSILILLGEECI